ncbi:MAG: cytochrome c, partial [Leptospiraceae bacterium]|nr:cytochrome c [Leptospiraceae bacterium]
NRKVPAMEYFPDMADSYAVESQEADYFAKNSSGARIPPEGTVPRGFYPYPYPADKYPTPETLTNPEKGLSNPVTKKTLAVYKRGEERYQIYCTPCHGVRGEGNGTVVGPKPRFAYAVPPLVSEKIQGWSDGQIYHIITNGRGLMGKYAPQIPSEDRWKIILYIRKLQEAHNKKVANR